MIQALAVKNVLSPPVLFFFLGVVSTFVRTDFGIPKGFVKFFSLYLLFAIGFKGGAELAKGGIPTEAAWAIFAVLGFSFLVPVYAFFLLRLRLGVQDAAALAAAFGSTSAVTFIATADFLNGASVPFGGYMVAAIALVESPAIIMGVFLANVFSGDRTAGWKRTLHEAALNGSVFLLTGSFLIGFAAGGNGGAEVLKPFTEGIFKGMLCFFLLAMGVMAGRKLVALREAGWFLVAAAIAVPVFNAFVGIGLARWFGLSPGDAMMLAVLCGSASYIAVPAAMQMALPKANPGVYVSMPLGVTFPFNLLVGIPLYYSVILFLWK